MSLFGDSPPATPSFAGKQAGSLFDDEPVQSKARDSTSSLFAENTASDSPWSMPTPKRNAKQDLVKTLLPATEVPESYIDAYDTLIRAGDNRGSSLGLTAVRKLLETSGLGPGIQERILNIVLSGQDIGSISRNEFNVLLALIGLAQEDDEATLDGVDERRKRLPKPKIGYLDAIKTQAVQVQQRSSDSMAPQKGKQDLMSDPASDPWASPAKNIPPSTAAHTQRLVDSSLASDTMNGVPSTTNDPAIDGQATGPDLGNAWGTYNAGNTFSTPVTAPDDFTNTSQQSTRAHRPVQGITVPRGTGEYVTISTLPDKEGLFLFQHHNYEVKTIRRGSSVVRRYSDFVWLLDCLQKRYPFRRLPLLPPKRVQVNGNHLAADGAIFLDKRRKGLVRFINALVQHPILSQETLVTMFLTVPTELSVWRKQATISVQEEFVGRALPPDLEDSLPSNLLDLFDQVRAGVKRAAEVYIGLCMLLERLAKRNEATAADNLKFSMALQGLTEGNADIYAVDTNDVPLLNGGIDATAKHLASAQTLLEDEARAWDAGAVEDFKKIRDAMVSMRDLFDRRDRLARDNIPQLERRIQNTENKLVALRQKAQTGQVKAGEMEKLETSIMTDKESIVQQHARGVLLKECIRDEIVTFQSTIYVTSHVHQDWAAERVKYAELQASNWRRLVEEVDSMPTGEQ